MAFQIEEFADVGRDGVPVPVYPPVAIQEVAVGVSSGASAALNARTRYVRVRTTDAARFVVGANPVAADDATSTRLPADGACDFAVHPGKDFKIAVIAAA